MRRIHASLVLALLCLGLALPFLQAKPGSVPACCRRDGKHRCAMSPNGDGFRTLAPACPYRHLGVLPSPRAALNIPSSLSTISAGEQLSIRNTLPLVALHSCDTAQQRGPPAS